MQLVHASSEADIVSCRVQRVKQFSAGAAESRRISYRYTKRMIWRTASPAASASMPELMSSKAIV